MGSVFKVGGACFQARPAGKPRTRHTSDRKLWWRGYEDGYYGNEATCDSPWYAHGHQEGAAAARRRDEIRTEIARDESRATAAPAYARLINGRSRGRRRGGPGRLRPHDRGASQPDHARAGVPRRAGRAQGMAEAVRAIPGAGACGARGRGSRQEACPSSAQGRRESRVAMRGGVVGPGRIGWERPGRAGRVRLGSDRSGLARTGTASPGTSGQARQVSARAGWPVLSGQAGMEPTSGREPVAWQARQVLARRGSDRHGPERAGNT